MALDGLLSMQLHRFFPSLKCTTFTFLLIAQVIIVGNIYFEPILLQFYVGISYSNDRERRHLT